LVGKIDPEEIIEYYIASDLFLFSSLSETQGMVIVEAMAGGCPVVALRASGIEDLIENKSNGFKTKNDLEKWTEKVIMLMKDKALREQLGKNAKEFSKAYSSEAIAEKVLEAYYYSIATKKEK
jgi:glycosyltransferase involved in cell wall biosynthesis